MTEKLICEQDGHVVTLTLNMPEARNPLTDHDLCDAILAAMARISAEQSVRVAIRTGAGKAFSSGGNLKHMKDKHGTFEGGVVSVKDGYRVGIQRVARAMWDCEVPLIAAANGAAYGARCGRTCLPDIRIAPTRATFAENFVNAGPICGEGGGVAAAASGRPIARGQDAPYRRPRRTPKPRQPGAWSPKLWSPRR
ncbi:enoyl-CoA hydratase-related protein [Albidovulum sediminicola]|uniref:Enoyl-CoA hydratase-related protein n=1 Tax=Albidovulum sediminicola TaxID=2984331 RepID=A0ABT2Z2J1_9RHOB|nr:enoyl-CoA hydratase-related protein [Defluviimonas sp. WL0075]MCV2865365.1 enoyl-CoA hydratase-related protein [Defluviimonas sp. WL0075]